MLPDECPDSIPGIDFGIGIGPNARHGFALGASNGVTINCLMRYHRCTARSRRQASPASGARIGTVERRAANQLGQAFDHPLAICAQRAIHTVAIGRYFQRVANNQNMLISCCNFGPVRIGYQGQQFRMCTRLGGWAARRQPHQHTRGNKDRFHGEYLPAITLARLAGLTK